MDNKAKLDELYALKIQIEGELFQKYFMKPWEKEMNALRSAYDCKTLNEMARLKGKKEGLEFIKNRLKLIDEEYKAVKYEIDSQGK